MIWVEETIIWYWYFLNDTHDTQTIVPSSGVLSVFLHATSFNWDLDVHHLCIRGSICRYLPRITILPLWMESWRDYSVSDLSLSFLLLILPSSGGFTISNDFSVYNCLWFTLAAFMQQGTDILPRYPSLRKSDLWSLPSSVLSLVESLHQHGGSSQWLLSLRTLQISLLFLLSKRCKWEFVYLFLIDIFFTSQLFGFRNVFWLLLIIQIEAPIESVEDLAKQTKIKYGIQQGGSTAQFFRVSHLLVYSSDHSLSSIPPSRSIRECGDTWNHK